MYILGMVTALVIGVAIFALIFWLLKKRKDRPVKGRGYGILVPIPIFAIFLSLILYGQYVSLPSFHFPPYWELLIAALLGVLFGSVMTTQTSYEEREDGYIYTKLHKNFKYVIIAIVVIRLALSVLLTSLDQNELTILTFALAIFYLTVWRIGCFIKFRKIKD